MLGWKTLFPLNDNLLAIGISVCFHFLFLWQTSIPLALAIVKISKFDSTKPSIILQVQTENQPKFWLVGFEIDANFKQQFRKPLEVYMSSSVANPS
jgi:hypothetical protein